MSSSLFHTLNISRQDILSRMSDLDVTSNNLANINTSGFKTSRSNFQEMLNKQLKEGIQIKNTQSLTVQGTLRESTNPLDWAIQGEGYFGVKLPDGKTGYTRDGQFSLDADNKLVTAGGYPLTWDGTITKEMTNITIGVDGKVTALDAKGATVKVGTVQLTRFPNPSALTSHGNNVWLESDVSGKAQAGDAGAENYGTIHSYRVEQSNVDLAREMTHMMTLQRSFSMSVKAFQQTDTMISQAINLRKA
jgi:flagellar basal-body rod protein FlgG